MAARSEPRPGPSTGLRTTELPTDPHAGPLHDDPPGGRIGAGSGEVTASGSTPVGVALRVAVPFRLLPFLTAAGRRAQRPGAERRLYGKAPARVQATRT